MDIEEIVQKVLGNDAQLCEQLQIIAETAYESLPPHVVERLEMHETEKNVLFRLTFRSNDKNFEKNEIKAVVDQIYRAVNHSTSETLGFDVQDKKI
jgi:phenylalanyl-tRNA synthetase beta subunit